MEEKKDRNGLNMRFVVIMAVVVALWGYQWYIGERIFSTDNILGWFDEHLFHLPYSPGVNKTIIFVGFGLICLPFILVPNLLYAVVVIVPAIGEGLSKKIKRIFQK